MLTKTAHTINNMHKAGAGKKHRRAVHEVPVAEFKGIKRITSIKLRPAPYPLAVLRS
ncbi:hypothetical protein ACO0LG_08640 [Undibacterium sp. Ji42W]|uniref:hypothetical protein n=1 Tax=Undibacterium sp. Ji42W TaxID=3413039 RepID=UPI003BF431E9